MALAALVVASTFTADRLLNSIDAAFWDPNRKLYVEGMEKGVVSQQPAFNWSVGVMVTALNAMAEESPTAKARLIQYLPAVESYWNSTGPVPGFDVLPTPKPVDRYYDDNAWMVLALIDSAKITGDRKWLNLAGKALDYALSGWAESEGGGIYWRESDKASRNTCSNSPTAAAAFAYYEATGEGKYKDWGLKIIKWTLPRLQDPSDGLMWDAIDKQGKIEKTKWSYNTALTAKAMIQAEGYGAKFSMTGRDLFSRAWKHWFDPTLGVKDEGRFAHLLVDVGLDYNLISLEDRKILVKQLIYLRDEKGLYGSRWDRKSGSDKREMIDSASVLRTLARL
jgi:hypothetical protein